MEFLEVQNLCKTYGKGDNQVPALDHVSRSFFAGSSYMLFFSVLCS